jgi:diguanylate cyclase (GGDEF)-like protein
MRRLSPAWLVLGVYAAWLLLPGLPDDVRTLGSNIALTAIPGWAAAACLGAAWRRRTAGGSKLSFALLGAGCLAWALGNGLWTVLVLTVGPTSFVPSPADPLYLLLIPLTAAALLCLPRQARDAVGRLRRLCDSCIVAASLLAVGWPLIVLPLVDERREPLAFAITLAYPAGDFALLTLMLPITLAAVPRWRPMMLQLTGALLALTAADVAYCVANRFGVYSSASAIAFGYAAAFLGVVAFVRSAGLYRQRDTQPCPPTRRRTKTALALLRHVPVVAVALTALVLLLTDSLNAVTGVALVVVLLLSSTRQQLAHWENDRLTGELEDRVQHRTKQLEVLAYTDPLTGLANRARFAQRLDEIAATEPVLLLLDLDGFKTINDTLGHAAGDELLALVAKRLRDACPRADVLARLGGDEFAVVLHTGPLADAAPVADLVLAELAAPFQVSRAEVCLGGSLGVAGGTGTGGDDILRHADLAMYAAKAAGRNCWRVFDPAMGRAAERRRALEDDLRVALDRDELSLYYQPVIDLQTGHISGLEALLRWHHPEHGLVSPDEFIPIAEETGLIVGIGAWVLQQACHQVAEWRRGLPPDRQPGVGVNLSVHQLQPGLVDMVAATLEESGLPANALYLEVTESVFMDDDRTDPEILQAIRRLDIKVFLDDFGTGYSSLSYLRRFPVDGLKIDRSFVRELGPEGEDVLAAAILHIADCLDLVVVAEGIEEPQQHAVLLELGCPLGQGFGLHRPMPADALERLLFTPQGIPEPRDALPVEV